MQVWRRPRCTAWCVGRRACAPWRAKRSSKRHQVLIQGPRRAPPPCAARTPPDRCLGPALSLNRAGHGVGRTLGVALGIADPGGEQQNLQGPVPLAARASRTVEAATSSGMIAQRIAEGIQLRVEPGQQRCRVGSGGCPGGGKVRVPGACGRRHRLREGGHVRLQETRPPSRARRQAAHSRA